jgi:hypothetical protein
MKKTSILCLFYLVGIVSMAQTMGNEWILPNQKYFKIPVAKNGIYRLDFSSLINAATDMKMDLTTVNPKKWQMYCNGIEVPIYVAGESDNIFNSSDFIEFFGKGNDGSLDQALFENPNDLANTAGSMYTDTAYYFLTCLPGSSASTPWHMTQYRNSAYANFTVEPYCWVESLVKYTDEYNRGQKALVSSSESENPDYTRAEGYCSQYFGNGNNYTALNLALNTKLLANSGPMAKLNFSVVGGSNQLAIQNDHHLKLYSSTDNFSFQTEFDTTYEGFDIIKKSLDLPLNRLSNQSTYFKFESQFISGVTYQAHAINYAKLQYPRQLDLDNLPRLGFALYGNNSPRHLDWKNLPNNFKSAIVYDLNNGVRMRTEKYNSNSARCIVPPSNGLSQYWICDSSDIVYLQPYQIAAGISSETTYDSLLTFDPKNSINQNKMIVVSHPKLMGETMQDFVAYKNTTAHTSPCKSISIQTLYNHFSYGIPHPIALQRYIQYLLKQGDTTLKFMLLVGRGYQSNLVRSNNLNKNLVPAIGVPASDNLFSCMQKDSNLVPAIATGRLSIDQEKDLSIYLNKLKTYDAQQDALWRKQCLHLAGGDNLFQTNLIKNKLDASANWVKSKPLGGSVNTFTKSAVGISEPYLKEKAIEYVNQGVQMITFLGHGSAAVTDIDIGDTSEYRNTNKYPIFYFNGCSIGNPCLGPPAANIKLSGELFVKSHQKGAIAFLGQTGLSELGLVDQQINNLYRQAYALNYNGNYTIGEAIQDMLYATNNYTWILSRIQARELFLQGDPSVRFYQPTEADYAVSDPTLFLYPNNATAVSDSFAIGIPIENKGQYSADSFNVLIERHYPNNFIVNTYRFRVAPIAFRDTLYLYIKSKDMASAGINQFIVNINYDWQVPESNYANNRAAFNPYIPGNGINLILPKRFDIVHDLNNDTVELKAQALNLFEKNYQFVFEIDTVPSFNSPWLKKDSAGSIIGQLKSWKVKLIGQKDSTVYYWRCRISTGTVQGGYWSERSFVHVFNHADGWSQSDFPQFSNSRLNNIELNTKRKTFEFSAIAEKVYVNTYVDKKPNFGIKKGGQAAMSLNPGASDNIVAVLFDRNTLQQIQLPGIFNPNKFYGMDYYENALKAYNFSLDPSNANNFIRWVDSIPDSTNVVLCNVNGIPPNYFTPQVLNAFEKLGAELVQHINSNLTSYAMIGKKGSAIGTALEDTGNYYDGKGGYIELEKNLLGKRGFGRLSSEWIGPTSQWHTVYFHSHTQEPNPYDSLKITVHAIHQNGKDTLWFKNITQQPIDISSIPAQTFPNIYLEAQFKDNQYYTPPQLKHWRVTASDVPEGSLNPNINASVWRDTLRQGETFDFSMAFQNISKMPFAKGLQQQVIIYQVDTKDTVFNQTYTSTDSLKANAFFMVPAKCSTKQMSGRYAYTIKVNFSPYQKAILPEQSLSNNTAVKYFYVIADNINPLLEVTFDGKRIMNGEIVSAKPVINIISKDENKLNWQSDSSRIKIWLKKPNSTQFEVIDFDSFNVKYFPATNAQNLARAEFQPTQLKDGIYTLKVQSIDASGNWAAPTEYSIQFSVIGKSSSTHFYPYPNPFTSSMRFVFTLTGDEVPEKIDINIMTIQGRIVKQIHKADLGPIRIGNNISEVVWDGTDEFGDRLANGVYLYVVNIQQNGERIQQLDNTDGNALLEADKNNNQLFKQAIGKIVLLK